jgi:hypothetical protein
MNIHSDKSPESKSKAISNNLAQSTNGNASTFQFVDNRPEAVVQRKIQEMANANASLNVYQRNASNVIQRDQVDSVALNQDDEQAGLWNINQDGLHVLIEHFGESWDVELHPLHQLQIGGFGNTFYGGYTLIYEQDDEVVTDQSRRTTKNPRIGEHTEKQYIEEVEGAILGALNGDALGVVIEINQTQSICTACQKYLTSKVNEWKAATGKKVIIRAQARDLYEHQSGQIGLGNQELRAGRGEGEELYPVMDNNDEGGYVGIHNYLRRAY